MRGEWDEALELIRPRGVRPRAARHRRERHAAAAAARSRSSSTAATSTRRLQWPSALVHADRRAADETPSSCARGSISRSASRPTPSAGCRRAHRRTDRGRQHLEAGRGAGRAGRHLRRGRPARRRPGRRDELDTLADRTGWPECRLPALRARARRPPGRRGRPRRRRVGRAGGLGRRAGTRGARPRRARRRPRRQPHRGLQAVRRLRGGAVAPARRGRPACRGLTVPRRSAPPRSSLTDTEVQLVRLVREGLSNRQIATAMHYSPKTIEVYLSRVYAKTGLRIAARADPRRRHRRADA